MATPPPLPPTISAVNLSRISSWIDKLPPSPRPQKRKRANSAPMVTTSRDSSPGKRQRRGDDVTFEQSVSDTGSSHPLSLSQHTTFPPPGSRTSSRGGSRTSSPLRETVSTLKAASPPILTEPYNGAQLSACQAISAKVMSTMDRLEPGQVDGWVPFCLKVRAHMR
jgi:hypothetical protein